MKKTWIKTAAKALIWSLFAFSLIIIGLLFGAVNWLKPDKLTPLANKAANTRLNADVSIGKVELSLRRTWPFLTMQVDSLTIISRDMLELPDSTREEMPAWADTLANVSQIRGGINILKLPAGKISLSDVIVDGPAANAFVLNDSVNNFSISKPSDKADTTTIAKVPDIRIKSFRITNPKPIRYADATTGTRVEAWLDTLSIYNQKGKKAFVPAYKATLNTNIESPIIEKFGILDLPIGFDGVIEWKHSDPMSISLSDFRLRLSEITGTLDTRLDFSDNLCAKSLSLAIDPIKFSEILALIPDSAKASMGIPADIETNAEISLNASLKKPFMAGVDSIPALSASIDMPEAFLKFGHVDLSKMLLHAVIETDGNDLAGATVDIKSLMLEGPSAQLSVAGIVSNIGPDPLFDGAVNGHVNLSMLPAEIARLAPGSIKGKIDIATDMQASPSMISRDRFHLLKLHGDVDLSGIYYVADDTLTMVDISSACIKFGTNENLSHNNVRMDSLLTASVSVDSSQILVSGLKIKVKGLSLGVGASNRNQSSDTTAIIPMGGRLRTAEFSLFSLSDTAGVRIADLNGSVAMQRYLGNAHLPLFKLNTQAGRISAGNNSTRFVVSNAGLNVSINKLADHELPAQRRQIKATADSLHRLHPDLPIDSVYVMALEIRNRHRRHGHRVHEQMDNDYEVIDWGTSTALRKLLLDWNLQGSLTANRAGLYSSAFPIPNRVAHLDIKFTNDSILLNDIAYKAGSSDFLIAGHVSNMKRAFASRRPSPLKINLEMASDTINVNEIAHALFTGAAQKKKRIDDDDEKMLAEVNGENKSDSVGPLLIPINIDAELKLRSKNIIYSDFILHDLDGSILAYDGALNLYRLQASSEVGSVDMSALYSAPTVDDMKFGLGLDLTGFNIHEFLELVPAIDSLMPMMRDFEGIINAQIAATSDINDKMNLVLPSMRAAVSIDGDSLVFINQATYKKIGKWLMFKDKNNNVIDHMDVNMSVDSSILHIYPFVFDIDRYRLGIQGQNDLNMNFNYHISVLKSPIPFKFGITVKGNPDKYKIRLGRSRFNEKESVRMVAMADTSRVNLINQFENVFRRGVRNSEFASINITRAQVNAANDIDLDADTISAADSLYLQQQGLLPEDDD